MTADGWASISRVRVIGRRFWFIDDGRAVESLPEIFDRQVGAFGPDTCLATGARQHGVPRELAIIDRVFDPNGHGWPLDRARVDASLRDMAHTAGPELVPVAWLAFSARYCNRWYVTLFAGGRSS